jgi:hypothetical protein
MKKTNLQQLHKVQKLWGVVRLGFEHVCKLLHDAILLPVLFHLPLRYVSLPHRERHNRRKTDGKRNVIRWASMRAMAVQAYACTHGYTREWHTHASTASRADTPGRPRAHVPHLCRVLRQQARVVRLPLLEGRQQRLLREQALHQGVGRRWRRATLPIPPLVRGRGTCRR